MTGGGRGIGAATARLAVQAGYAVGIAYRQDRAAAEGIVADIAASGGQALAVQADVSAEADVTRLFAEVEARLGPLSALVNNAGVLERQARLDEMTPERWRRVLEVNVIGTLLCAREAVRRLSTRHGGAGGAIVNVSSRAARLGAPGEYVDYAASKGAVESFTRGLARELAAEGVRVNAVSPGVIRTEIHASGGEPGRPERVAPGIPMRRPGEPEEVAQAILWLLSDAAAYVTGTVLEVAGGR